MASSSESHGSYDLNDAAAPMTRDIDKLVERVNRMAAGNPYESGDFLRSVSDALATLAKRLEEAEKVIRPFAALAHAEYDDVPNVVGVSLTFDNGEELGALPFGDLRAARRWMEGKQMNDIPETVEWLYNQSKTALVDRIGRLRAELEAVTAGQQQYLIELSKKLGGLSRYINEQGDYRSDDDWASFLLARAEDLLHSEGDQRRRANAAEDARITTADVASRILIRAEAAEARAAQLEAENGRLLDEIKRLKTPDNYWDWDDPESGYDNFQEPVQSADMGAVVRLLTGKTLGTVWATTRVLTVDENGDWDDSEIVCFDTKEEAERCWPESLEAARATLTGREG